MSLPSLQREIEYYEEKQRGYKFLADNLERAKRFKDAATCDCVLTELAVILAMARRMRVAKLQKLLASAH